MRVALRPLMDGRPSRREKRYDQHLTEDELILHFYGERRDDEAAVDAHLRSCETCQTAWAGIAETLKMVDDAAGAGAGRRVRTRDVGANPAGAARSGRPGGPSSNRWSGRRDPGPARGRWPRRPRCVLVVALGRPRRGEAGAAARPVAGETAGPRAVGATGDGRERVLLTALDDHFQRSEMLLVEVMNAPASGRRARVRTADGRRPGGIEPAVSAPRPSRTATRGSRDARRPGVGAGRDRPQSGAGRSARISILFARALTATDLLFKVRAVSKQIQDRQRTCRLSEDLYEASECIRCPS